MNHPKAVLSAHFDMTPFLLEVKTQRLADNPTAPGGRDWEIQTAKARIANLTRIVELNTAELAAEQARLDFLESLP